MYPLGQQFFIDPKKAKSDPKICITGSKYRISVLTERVVRIEYNPNGVFVDQPSEFVINRNIGVPPFTVRQVQNTIEIDTKYFILTYVKEQPLVGNNIAPGKNLKITLVNKKEKERERTWYYKHPEVRNMKGNISGFDVPLNSVFERGLYSIEGFASFDDSNNKLIGADGTLIDRPEGHTDVYVFMYDTDFKEALKNTIESLLR